jgi:glucosylceramidase
MYAHDIIGDLNAGANGYIDWNILLDYKGGPNHKKNYCNSPIMLNENASDYYKNLSYYYIKHFSNIIKQNAKALQISNTNQELEITAFINNDNSVAIIVLNKTNNYLAYNIKIDNITINDGIKAHSIISYLI